MSEAVGAQLEALRSRFSGAALSFEAGPGGLPAARLSNVHGTVCVTLHGAHVLECQLGGGHALLWRSQESFYEEGKPIRGGVPICWPWFGPHPEDASKPSHGVARIATWDLVASDGETTLEFELRDVVVSKALWPYAFELRYVVSLTGEGLRLSLTTTNRDSRSFRLSAALHSYFGVASIDAVRVHGLDRVSYWDQLDSLKVKEQTGAVAFDREVDRIYVDAPPVTEVKGHRSGQRVRIASQGSQSTVVWNPWIEKAQRMPDFGDSEYQEMVCVETANAGPDTQTLDPGAQHTLTAHLSLHSNQD